MNVVVVTKTPHRHKQRHLLCSDTDVLLSLLPSYDAQGQHVPFPAHKAMAEGRTYMSAVSGNAPTGTHV